MNRIYGIVLWTALVTPAAVFAAGIEDRNPSPESVAAEAAALEAVPSLEPVPALEPVSALDEEALQAIANQAPASAGCCQGMRSFVQTVAPPAVETASPATPQARLAVQPLVEEASTRLRSSIANDQTWQANNQQMRLQPRIVFGVPVTTNEYDNVVYVESSCCICTGTLISPNVVLTADHCLFNKFNQEVQVREVRFGNDLRTGEAIRVKSQHRIRNGASDIAILILSRRASVAPRPIATQTQLNAAVSVQVVGFGYTQNGRSDIKMKADVPIVAIGASNYGSRGDEFAAAGDPNQVSADTCNGDSGGPALVWLGGNDYRLAGVTSRPIDRSGVINIPGVGPQPCGYGGIYVSVPANLDAIKQVIATNQGDPIPTIVTPPQELTPEVKAALEKLRDATAKLEAALKN
jgi:hypothetical protein